MPFEGRSVPRRAWLVAILGVAATLRFAGLGSHSLWYDEVVTMTLARQAGPAAMARALGEIDATRAPLHPLLLQGWLAAFGPSDLAGRALGAVFGSIVVVLVYWVGRRAFDEATALWGAWLLAISPIEVQYAQEVRMYSWLVLLTCLCWGLLLSFRRSAPPWKQAAYATGLAALAYSHPLGGLMIVALALGYLATAGGSRLTRRSWLLIQVAVALAFAPWASRYLDHPPDLKYPRHYQAWNWPKAFIGGNDWAVSGCYLLAVVGGLRLRKRGDESGSGRPRIRLADPSATALLLIWLLVPPLLIHLYSAARHPISGPIRYVLYVGPAFLLLVARGLARLPRRPRLAAALAVAVLAGPAIRERAYDPEVKPDWRAAAATARRVAPRASVVLLCTDEHFYLPTLRYYLGPDAKLAPVGRYAAALAGAGAEPEGAIWTIVDRIDGIRETPGPLAGLYEPAETWKFGRLSLTLNRLRADRPVPAAALARSKADPAR